MRPALRTLLPLLICSVVALAGCSGDQRADPDGSGAQTTGGDEPQPPVGAEPGVPVAPQPEAPALSGNDAFTLRTAQRDVAVVEGGAAVPVQITLTRAAGFTGAVTLAAQPASAADARDLGWSFDNVRLVGAQSSAEVQVWLNIGARPRQTQQRTLLISATDGASSPVVSELILQITPTSAPDVYLLVGQSNMIGFSEENARLAGPGQPDAPDTRISQLNPTGNDQANFATAADFTDASIAADPTLSLALDPLHDGFDSAIDSKDSGFVGSAMSFAKAALADTTAGIVLVPAAWSDTGFCARESNLLPGLGWLPQARTEAVFAGTLLHDRAVARTDLALAETGGVLRGILWHQGEADATDPVCAAAYAENLAALVDSLRTNVAVDARGPAARGPSSDIPFVVGTLSMGSDVRGSQLPFTADKQVVDGALRTVANTIPMASVVINDDLVPPAFPCGESSCIHFGAAALREMGARYYGELRGLLDAL